jgi:hypothetical protein
MKSIGIALVASLVLGTTSALAEPPTSRSFDASLPRPFLMELRGANFSEAWVSMSGRASRDQDQGVVDLKTGCIVETMPRFPRIAALERLLSGAQAFSKGAAADRSGEVEAQLADAATRSEIARWVSAGRRFGRRDLGIHWAFSDDGQTLLTTAGETAFRSRDGARSFQRLDANMSRSPTVTPDGKWLMYERCADASRRNQSCPDGSRQVRVVASDGATPPRDLPIGGGRLHGLDPSGRKLVVVRDDVPSEVTVMHLDPAAGTLTRAFGVTAPPLPQNRFHDIDPSPAAGAFGIFNNNHQRPFSHLTVVSMADGRVVQRLSVRNEMGTIADEETGRVLWQTFYDDHVWARAPQGATRDLGVGDPLGWAPGGRALVFAARYSGGRRVDEPPGTLGSVACKLIRITAVK